MDFGSNLAISNVFVAIIPGICITLTQHGAKVMKYIITRIRVFPSGGGDWGTPP